MSTRQQKIAIGLTALALVLTLVAFFLCSDHSDFYFLHDKQAVPTKTTNSSTVISQAKQKEDPYQDLPNVSSQDWNLLLVNDEHPCSAELQVTLKDLANGYQIDERIYSAFAELQQAAANEGITLLAVSAYRSADYQKQLFDQDVAKYMNQGFSEEEAQTKTKEYMTYPGCSEHQTGLAIDVSSTEDIDKGLVPELSDTTTGKWLMNHSAEYGFIIRYPKGKESITKINYEPWHIRYVGKENAEYMVKHNLVLEEYLALLQKAGK